jgi:hypothetical protein
MIIPGAATLSLGTRLSWCGLERVAGRDDRDIRHITLGPVFRSQQVIPLSFSGWPEDPAIKRTPEQRVR